MWIILVAWELEICKKLVLCAAYSTTQLKKEYFHQQMLPNFEFQLLIGVPIIGCFDLGEALDDAKDNLELCYLLKQVGDPLSLGTAS